ncbi:MAG TPA: hypothetical protein VJP80_04835 [Candidatus Saccharimonadales bacterium]|nr:hypothetical protein [Candidatus Saccharimonadales bacterium]
MDQQPINAKDVEPTYQPPHYPYVGAKRPSFKRWWLLILAIAVALAATAVALWLFVFHKPKAAPAPARHATQTQTPALTPAQAATLQTYKSAKLNVQVTYRRDWTLKESADKSEIILSSPSTTYQKVGGTSATGPFTVKIREDVPAAMQTTITKSVAAEDSTIIAYSQPTDQQRQYTNVSFAGANPNVFNFFMVTGDNAYKAGAAFGTGIDLTGTTYIIAGGYGSDGGDALGFDGVPKANAESTVYDQGMDVVKSLQVF